MQSCLFKGHNILLGCPGKKDHHFVAMLTRTCFGVSFPVQRVYYYRHNPYYKTYIIRIYNIYYTTVHAILYALCAYV